MKTSTARSSTPRGTSLLCDIATGRARNMPEPPPSAVRQHRLGDDEPGRARVAANMVGLPAADFTPAEKALIRRVHGYMAPLQLLGILNERLAADQGNRVAPYTIEQLRREIASVASAVPASTNDWGTLRKLVAKARRDGTLGLIDEQVIDDFAVVFSLNHKQVLILKDILLDRTEDES